MDEVLSKVGDFVTVITFFSVSGQRTNSGQPGQLLFWCRDVYELLVLLLNNLLADKRKQNQNYPGYPAPQAKVARNINSKAQAGTHQQ